MAVVEVVAVIVTGGDRNPKLLLDIHYSVTLDNKFHAYYVNKYIDHHASEITF